MVEVNKIRELTSQIVRQFSPERIVLFGSAVEYRYPGDSADLDEAKEAFQKCEAVRKIIRQALHL